MPETLPVDHPNLQLARRRVQRTQWLWAVLLSAMGWLSYQVLRPEHPLVFLPWVAAAILLIIEPQPLLLALVAMLWALSLANLLPGVSALLGPDPLAQLFEAGSLETLVAIFVRLVMVVTALNQFLLYRMLYGTQASAGLDDDMPALPEVITNRADGYAFAAALLGVISVLVDLSAVPLAARGFGLHALTLALSAAVFAIGFGVGSAFSPTKRRSASLLGIGLGAAAYLIGIAIGTIL
ncbi:MAG: hypothetical protein ACK2T2_03915 [Anaerolineales bacterium]